MKVFLLNYASLALSNSILLSENTHLEYLVGQLKRNFCYNIMNMALCVQVSRSLVVLLLTCGLRDQMIRICRHSGALHHSLNIKSLHHC